MKWLALAMLTLWGCDDFDQLEDDALDAGRFATGGGAAGGSSGGTAGGTTAGGAAGGTTAGGAGGGLTAGGGTAGGGLTMGGGTAGGGLTMGGGTAGGGLTTGGGTAGGGLTTGGGSAGGSTAGGAAGGSGGGAVCLMACPPADAGCSASCFTLPLTTGTGFSQPAIGLATTQSLALVAFAGLLDGGSGFGIARLTSPDYAEFNGTLLDLDARFGQALAVRSTGVALFDGGAWSLVTPPPNTAVGACQTGAIYGTAGNPSRVVNCVSDGGYAAHPLDATGAWQQQLPVPLPGLVLPDSSRVRPSGSNGVVIARAGSDWFSAWVPASGLIQSTVMPNAEEVMVCSNEAQVPWVAATTPGALHLWEVTAHISQFPPIGVSPLTGQFQLRAVAAADTDTRAVAFKSSLAQSTMVLGQVINLGADETTLLTLRANTVFVTPLGTAVDKVWLGFTNQSGNPILHVVVNCAGTGSLACSAAGPGALHYPLRLP